MPTLAHFVDDLTNVTNGKDDYARDNNIGMCNVNAAHFHLSFTLCKCWRYDNRIIPTVIITVDFALELCIYTVRACDNEELHYQVIIQQHRSSSKENISRKKNKSIKSVDSRLFLSQNVCRTYLLCVHWFVISLKLVRACSQQFIIITSTVGDKHKTGKKKNKTQKTHNLTRSARDADK